MRDGFPPLTEDDHVTAAAYAERALAGGSDDATVIAHCASSMIHPTIGAPVRGLELARRAVGMNPNDVYVVGVAGVANLLCGEVDDALSYLRRALVLSPRDPLAPVIRTGIAHAHMILGAYQEALLEADKSFALFPQYRPTHWMLVAANAHLGRMDEARRRLAIFLSMHPKATIAAVRATQPDYDPTRIAAIIEGLRIAGLPES
jgi:tetratricopeptide (TPR) repeat protein